MVKRIAYILVIALGIGLPALLHSPSAQAQYYGSYYPGYFPGYYGCLKGCGKAYTIATALAMGAVAADTGLQIYQYNKANEDLTRQYQYQAEEMKARANYSQRVTDYKNILRVAPFFADDVPHYPTGQNSPQVKSFSKNSSSEVKR